MLTKSFTNHLELLLSGLTGKPSVCTKITILTGGSINNAVCFMTTVGNYFLKYNDSRRFPGMFGSENRGLELLRSTKAVHVPETLLTGEFENTSFLVMEMILPGKKTRSFFETLGQQLALLHRHCDLQWGLNHDNYIGSIPQSNQLTVSGCDFMIRHRYRPLVGTALRKNLISATEALLFEKLYDKLPELLPDEKSSLLHGDLWNGNVITGPEGNPWLIDPAVYYGYRETDIAMSKLFGGFDDAFYKAYNETFPLYPGWEKRIGLFQLYPLLVHLNLFGRGYKEAILSELRTYTL